MKRNRFENRITVTLLAVLVLMVVVSLIAVVITKITIVNIEMKEEIKITREKKNFYSADKLMDNLRAGADGVVYPEKQIAEWAAIRYLPITTSSTSSSVSGRGMITPGVTRKVLPKKRASPKIYCIGSKLCKRARMLSNSCSSFTDKIISLPR